MDTPKTPIIQSLVKKILQSPYDLDWQVQGLGMLRTYLDDERRLHIWHSSLVVPNVSKMHTHPWNFKSIVVAGSVTNQKYFEDKINGHPYHRQSIFCGVGGGLEGAPETVLLSKMHPEIRVAKESYTELAHEIHVSQPVDGTVTIIRREYLDDVDHAYVYWEHGNWVSAEPRKATREEIENITTYSLATWFYDDASPN